VSAPAPALVQVAWLQISQKISLPAYAQVLLLLLLELWARLVLLQVLVWIQVLLAVALVVLLLQVKVLWAPCALQSQQARCQGKGASCPPAEAWVASAQAGCPCQQGTAVWHCLPSWSAMP